MPAYMIAEVFEVSDLETFRKYNSIVPGTVAKHGGRFLVRGDNNETIEGNWDPGRLVVVEFDDMTSLRTWYNSPEYRQAQPLRAKSTRSNVVFSEGSVDAAGTGGEA